MKKLQSQQAVTGQNNQISLLIAILFVVMLWVLVEYTTLVYRNYQTELKKEWFVTENTRLVENNKRLQKRYEYYKTDFFVRKEAKRKLNMKEPGEKVIVVTGGDSRIKPIDDWRYQESTAEKWWKVFFPEEEFNNDSF